MSNQEKTSIRPWKDVDQAYIRLEEHNENGKSAKGSDLSLSRPKSTGSSKSELEMGKEGYGGTSGPPTTSTVRTSRLFYWGFVCPPLWLLGVIILFTQMMKLPTSGAAVGTTRHRDLDVQVQERKYAIRCLYAFLIFTVTMVGVGVTIWAVLVLKKFEGEVRTIGM